MLPKRDTNLQLILFWGQGPKIYKAKLKLLSNGLFYIRTMAVIRFLYPQGWIYIDYLFLLLYSFLNPKIPEGLKHTVFHIGFTAGTQNTWSGVALKVVFFSEREIRFSNLQISKKIIPKHYPELEIWISCLLLWAVMSNFKCWIVIWNIFFWRFE